MIWWDYCSQSGSCSCSTPSSCKMKWGNILIYAVKYVHIELFVKSEWISPPKEPVETFVFHKNQSTSADPAFRITTDLNSFPHFAKWLMTVICASHLCVCVCAFALISSLRHVQGLSGPSSTHLLNIRGNNSWADLKHGHPLHLAVSPRRSAAASRSRWQVAVSPAHRWACW